MNNLHQPKLRLFQYFSISSNPRISDVVKHDKATVRLSLILTGIKININVVTYSELITATHINLNLQKR